MERNKMVNTEELYELYEKYIQYQRNNVDNWQEHAYWDGVKNSHEEMSDMYFTKFTCWLTANYPMKV